MIFRCLFSSLAALLLLAACNPGPDTVATIDGRIISRQEVQARLQAGLEIDEPTSPVYTQNDRFTAARSLLEQLIDEYLLLMEAGDLELPLNSGPEKQQAIKLVLRKLARKVPYPNQDEARQYYEQHPEQFKTETRFRIEHLLLADEHSAWELKEKIDQGEITLSAAGEQQLLGARLAIVNKKRALNANELPVRVAEELKRMQPGELSQVIASPHGYHLVRLQEIVPGGMIPLAEAENQIKDMLFALRLRENYQDWLKQARQRHKIEIYPQNLNHL